MARIKGKDLFLKNDDQIYFGTNQEAALWYDNGDLNLNNTISGVDPTTTYHLTTKKYVDDNDIFEFTELTDTPSIYTGSQYLYVRVKSDETGLEFAEASGIEGPKGDTGFGVWASAVVDGDGTVKDSFNLNVNRTGTGTYVCTFNTQPPDAYYGIDPHPFQTVTDTNAMVSSITTTGFTVTIGQGDNGGTPDVLADTDFSVLVYKSEGLPNIAASGINFLQLLDTPSDYIGSGGYSVRVKDDETGLEFVPTSSGADLSFLDLTDTPTVYSGSENKFARVKPDGTGIYFENAIVGVTSSGTTPPDDSNLWYNSNDNEFYYYDPIRGDWLSLTVHNYLFTRRGNVDGLYLSIGDLRHAESHFPIPKYGKITGVISSAEETANSSKGFELRDESGSTLFSFNHSSWEYTNTSVNVNLNENSRLRAFCVSAGQRCRNPAITVEIRWRYVP